ncbi:MAG TPA: thiol reductant ABC exporter subunit CydD [Actinophytocola sp.]|uniref:thiol reductant ABC exporter subunit CydD n=1 Tax=Actinophytocola sp. TaxID=1872138 RepID=UPI002DBEEA41|nr:thiol reductant ABC exporter subunit CydD [Actinophytocola sp.]HEU5475924.1 thiol reductant ABC exporter subunit CydD [Actinophytocola sp.]
MRPLDPRLLRHARAARPFVLACAGLGTLSAGLVLLQAEALATAISRAFLDGAALAALAVPIGLLGLAVLGRAAVAWVTETTAHRASAGVLAQLRAAVVDAALCIGPGRRAGRSPAELATLATSGVDRLDGYFARYLPQLLIAAVVPLVVGLRILLADWVAALIIGVTVPLIPAFMILIGRWTARGVRRQWRSLAVLGNHFLDLVAGLAVLTAFGRARAQRQALAEITDRYRARTMGTLRVAFLSALVLELLATLSVALVAVSIGLRLVTGGLDLHTALVVLILAPEVYLPLRAVGARFHDSAEGVAAAEEILELLGERGDPAGRRAPAPDPSAVAVRLCGVRVAGRSAPVLDGLDLRVGPGEILGVTGPSGAGKSTLLDLLLGWYPPDAGQVRVDGVDLADLDRDAWQARVAWVPQHPRLVSGTVVGNIRLGRPDATTGQVVAAAAAAGLDIPLDTSVGELGAGLSTGQQRRVALARALLLDRPLLLLDEPTEGVDADTEAAIVDRLPGLLFGRTAVIVSHRPAVLGVCDRVVHLGTPVTGERHVRPRGTRAVPPEASPAPEPGHAAATAGRVGWLRAAVRPYRVRLALACLAGAAALGSGVALTATSAWLISAAALHPPVLTLMVAIVAVRTFGLAKGVLRYAERLLSHDVALRALADLRVRVWTTLVRIGPAVTARMRRGDLLNRLVSDVDSQQDVLVRALVPAASAAAVAAGITVGIGLLLPAAGLVVAAGLLLAGLLAPALSALTARDAERRTASLRAEVSAGTLELLAAAPDLIAFGATGRRHAAVRAAGTALTRALRRSATARGAGSAVATMAIGASTVGCLVLGIAALRAGRIAGPELAVLALTPLAAAELVAGLPEAAARLLGASRSARRLAELDATATPVAEPAVPRDVSGASRLAAAGLAVRWPGAPTDALTGLGFRLDAHRGAVLTGPSGSGKSTAIAAVLRNLDPSAGRITLDTVDTRHAAPDAVRARIAWCGPDTHLFDSTLRENLRLARPDAGDGELRAALHRARLGGWLDSLPHGLDTALGAHGTAVSGGERARIGVARALLADRPFLVLDEPTAHLDGATAAELAADLAELTANRAALIVTHRPAEFPGLAVIRLARPAGSAAVLIGSANDAR